MKALEDRPVLFRYSLDEYGTARRSAIVRTFIDALTKGGSSGTPRPIELHSHDPLRYVGDMMAWIHQACATEKEYLKTILKDCVSEDKDSLALNVMSHVTEGLGRPLKVRLEQVLLSDPQPIVLYKLTNLLQFYYGTLKGILPENAALVQSMTEMHNLNTQMFYNSLNSITSRLLEKVEMPPVDLSATSSVTSTLQLLQDILSSHDSSLVSVDIVKAVIEPLVKMCSVSASNLKSTDMATYMLNNLHLMHTTLTLFEFTDNKLEMLKALMEAHVDTLISEQAAIVLTRTNLVEFYQKVQQHNISLHGPLSQLPAADAATLKSAMAKFDSYLASPDSLVLPQCNALMSTKLRDSVKQRSTELICRAYSSMYQALKLSENEYPEANTIAPRTPDQVMKLLT
ncbi:DgyrCDS3991 [Dimorphilus gyrociliatus]|uniref:DgyrCDS3991 n=1 Tax=Dimorphilus gyrociliatus TaxID=2664684 RepID=A0A7I8VFK4_9ANNE|nr:DgyrCDS3991 [Dimorphilus gyrociliatus]